MIRIEIDDHEVRQALEDLRRRVLALQSMWIRGRPPVRRP